MEDIYMALGVLSGLILYDIGKWLFNRLRRRWGENPSDATYGGKK